MSDVSHILTPEFLIQVHDVRYNLPRGKVDWQKAYDLTWKSSENTEQLFSLMKPVWPQLCSHPDIKLPDPTSDKYIEQCLGLVWVLDQSTAMFKGRDIRWSGLYFRPLATKMAMDMHAAGVLEKETWLSRGWTSEEYIARISHVWAPLVHSEEIMHDWSFVKKVIHVWRDEIESHTKIRYPGRDTEEQDEQDLRLFDELVADIPSDAHTMDECCFPLLKILTAHLGPITAFGRYPYRNDACGRDFTKAEEDWINGCKAFRRMDLKTRQLIREEVDADRWRELELNYDV